MKTRATSKSVRDLPVRVSLRAGQIVCEQRVCGIGFSFPASVWPATEPLQREWVERLTPWWDINRADWTPRCQRLREACWRAINEVM